MKIDNDLDLPEGLYAPILIFLPVILLVSFVFGIIPPIIPALLWAQIGWVIPITTFLVLQGEAGQRLGENTTAYAFYKLQRTYPPQLGIKVYSVDEIKEMKTYDLNRLKTAAEEMLYAYNETNHTDISSTLSEMRNITASYNETAEKMRELSA